MLTTDHWFQLDKIRHSLPIPKVGKSLSQQWKHWCSMTKLCCVVLDKVEWIIKRKWPQIAWWGKNKITYITKRAQFKRRINAVNCTFGCLWRFSVIQVRVVLGAWRRRSVFFAFFKLSGVPLDTPLFQTWVYNFVLTQIVLQMPFKMQTSTSSKHRTTSTSSQCSNIDLTILPQYWSPFIGFQLST